MSVREYNPAQLKRAEHADLASVLEKMGYQIRRDAGGSFPVSRPLIRIRGSFWTDTATGKNGNVLSYFTDVLHMTPKAAVRSVLDEFPESDLSSVPEPRPAADGCPFCPPEPLEDQSDCPALLSRYGLTAYSTRTAMESGRIYVSCREPVLRDDGTVLQVPCAPQLVFVGFLANCLPRSAYVLRTEDNSSYLAPGSDPGTGFLPYEWQRERFVSVFRDPMDLLMLLEYRYRIWRYRIFSDNYLSLNGTSADPLYSYLLNHPWTCRIQIHDTPDMKDLVGEIRSVLPETINVIASGPIAGLMYNKMGNPDSFPLLHTPAGTATPPGSVL